MYHNMLMGPVRGHDAIRQIFDLFLPPSGEIDWEVHNVASAGYLVFAERTDRFLISGKTAELPVVGVFDGPGRGT